MSTRYAYSYDREGYQSAFDTAEEALRAGIANAEGLASPPTEVYVGQLVEADPQTTDHAEAVIHAMRQRALVDVGDAARKYLKHVTPRQVRELDALLAQTIQGWLERNGLAPNFVRVQGMREYPVTFPISVGPGAAGENGSGAVFGGRRGERAWCCEGAD